MRGVTLFSVWPGLIVDKHATELVTISGEVKLTMSDPLSRLARVLGRTLGPIIEAAEEVETIIKKELEEALGEEALQRLYKLPDGREPSIEEMIDYIRRSLGLDEGVSLEEYLKSRFNTRSANT